MERRLAAILAADVEGYTRLMRTDEEATLETLSDYREVIEGLIARHEGRVFSEAGDSVLAEFGSVVEAVRCAVEIQEDLATRNAELPEDRALCFRIGITIGDVMVRDDDLFGDGVNVAARLEGLAEATGICISGSVFEQVKHKLSLGFEDMGPQKVKNIAEPVSAYRIVPGPVAVAAGAATAPVPRPAARWRIPAIAAVVALVLAVGAVAVWQTRPGPSPEPRETATKTDAVGPRPALPRPGEPSIAVLPFANMSGDPGQESFSDGITEDIITDLSKVPGLSVSARNSVFTYKGKAVKVQQVAEDLGVRYVLEGSVRKAGDRLRITAQLVDAVTGDHLWAERYDRDLEDTFAVQDEVAREVVAALAATLKPAEPKLPPGTRTRNSEAYDLFLRAQRHPTTTLEHVLAARRMFERVIDLDPEFAGGYAGSSWTYAIAVRHGFSKAPRGDADKAFELAQKAVAIDDAFAWSHTALATAYLVKGQHERAVASAERAVEIRPDDAHVHANLGLMLMFAGRAEDAIEPTRKALRLNPRLIAFSTGPYLKFSGFAYFTAGRYEEALAAFDENAARGGSIGAEVLAYATAAYGALGRVDEARAAAQELLDKYPNFSLGSWPWLHLYKDPEDAKRLLDGLRKADLPG